MESGFLAGSALSRGKQKVINRRPARPTEEQLQEAFARLALIVQSKWEDFLAEHGYDQHQIPSCGVPWADVAHQGSDHGRRGNAFLAGGPADQLVAQGKEPTQGVGQDIGIGLFEELIMEQQIRLASQMHLASVACCCQRMARVEKHATMAAVAFSFLFFRLKLDLNWQKKMLSDRQYSESMYGPPDQWHGFTWLTCLESLPAESLLEHKAMLRLAETIANREGMSSDRPEQPFSRLLRLDRECLGAVLRFLSNRDLANVSMACSALRCQVWSDFFAQLNPALQCLKGVVQKVEENDMISSALRERFAVHPLDGTRAFKLGMEPAALSTEAVSQLYQVQQLQQRSNAHKEASLKTLAPKPPHPLSSRVAAFNGTPLDPLYASELQQQQEKARQEQGGLGEALRFALCDVQPLEGVGSAGAGGNGGMSASGSTLAFQHNGGWKRRSQKLTALDLRYSEPNMFYFKTDLQHGMHDFVGGGVLVDEANGVIWASGCGGFMVTGFPVPLVSEGHLSSSASRGVRYVLRPRRPQRCSGLHAEKGSVFSIGRRGGVAAWRLEEVPEGSGGSDDDGDEFDEASQEDGSPECQPSSRAYRGEEPSHTFNLHLPNPLEAIVYAKVAPSGGGQHVAAVVCSWPSAEDDSSDPFQEEADGGTLLLYDWETARLQHASFGHLSEICDVAAAPETLPLGPLLATAAMDGVVKVWDLRCPSTRQPAIMTLVTGDRSSLCCCFAETCSSSSILFTGCNESIAAWDLRGSSARALYKLSTGNGVPQAMAWSGPSSSLIVNVGVAQENRHGESNMDEFHRVSAEDPDRFLDPYDDDSPELWWPKRAVHRPKYFRHPWAVYSSCLISYTFNAGAPERGPGPFTDEPLFKEMNPFHGIHFGAPFGAPFGFW